MMMMMMVSSICWRHNPGSIFVRSFSTRRQFLSRGRTSSGAVTSTSITATKSTTTEQKYEWTTAKVRSAFLEKANQGPAAYGWASDVALHQSRRGKRRVIHASSLGAAAKKEEDRRAINVEEKIMRLFTRRDYIKCLDDQELKGQVCKTPNKGCIKCDSGRPG
jgi:hypothetical protein